MKKTLEENRMIIGGSWKICLSILMNKWPRSNCFRENWPQLCAQTFKLQINLRGPLWEEPWEPPMKLINPPSLPLFSEEAVSSGIMGSVRGEVRELIGFIGFQAYLMDILD